MKWSYALRVQEHHLQQLMRLAGRKLVLRVWSLVWFEELSVEMVAKVLNKPKPGICRALRTLYEAGLVKRRQEGRYVYYRRVYGKMHPALWYFQKMTWAMMKDCPMMRVDRAILENFREMRWKWLGDLPWPREDEREG